MEAMPLDILTYCRDLRRTMTKAECLLWGLLRGHRLGGFKFRRQKAIGRYIVDFYCASCHLAAPLDGGGHTEPLQKRYDECRTAALDAAGIIVLRLERRSTGADRGGAARDLAYFSHPR